MTSEPSEPSPLEPSLSELADLAVDLAWSAGRITLRYFQTPLDLITKSDGSPVTIADRSAEEFLRRSIRERFPADGILGEEHGEEPGTSGRTWIVDPIDGTKSFVRGVPLYSLLIGIEIDGEVKVGVIHLPALGEMVSAYRGGGCTWNGRRARVSETADLAQGLVTMSDFPRADGDFTVPVELLDPAGLRRTWGDGYGYAMVATGRAEVMIDPIANVWDLAAVQPIIEEAGGRASDLTGERTIRGGNFVATNGRLHDQVLEIVQT